jgi:hypothetical protein
MTDSTPTDADIRLASFQVLHEMREQSKQMTEHLTGLTDFVMSVNARVHGTEAVAKIVDDNEAERQIERQVSVAKELMSHWFEKSHQYVTVIIGGAFAAYFTTLAVMSSRFNDFELRLSAILMTISLTAFLLWEVANIALVGFQSAKGKFDAVSSAPRWYVIGWVAIMAITLSTALPAIGLSIYVYGRDLMQSSITDPPPAARKAPAAGP